MSDRLRAAAQAIADAFTSQSVAVVTVARIAELRNALAESDDVDRAARALADAVTPLLVDARKHWHDSDADDPRYPASQELLHKAWHSLMWSREVNAALDAYRATLKGEG